MASPLQAFSDSWKTDTFSTKDQLIDLKIEHSFWSHTNIGDRDGAYLVSNITVTNTGTLPLNDVKVQVEPDDTASMFDIHICDSSGNILDAKSAYSISFGNLLPGTKATQMSYWWTAEPRFQDASESESTKTTFNLYPTFNVDFKQKGVIFASTSVMDAWRSVVFRGLHSHVDGYAKDSPMTVIVWSDVLAGEPSATVKGLGGRLMITWARDAHGVENSMTPQDATVTREGKKLIVQGPYYRLEGELTDEGYSGNYINPRKEHCGSFKLVAES